MPRGRYDKAEIKIVKRSQHVPKPIIKEEAEDSSTDGFELIRKSDRERRGRIVAAQAMICTALVLVLALIRSGSSSFSKNTSEYIKNAVTAEVTADTAIGALKFVKNGTERAAAVFAGNSTPTGIDLTMPAGAKVSGRFIAGVHEKVELTMEEGCVITSPMSGTVLGVLSDETGAAVAIENGEYVMILQGLEKCTVAKGAEVEAGDGIGSARNGDNAVMYMTLYFGDDRIDPLPEIYGSASQ